MLQKFMTKMSSLKKTATLLTLVTFSACASIFSCRAEFRVHVYGFDNSKGILYFGQKEAPDDSIPLGDKRTDTWIAMSIADWEAVRVYCKVPN